MTTAMDQSHYWGEVWNHFTMLNHHTIMCLHCNTSYNKDPDGSTSSMWSHLRSNHPATIAPPETNEVASGNPGVSELEHMDSGRARQSSIVWNHFTFLDATAVSCLHCNKNLMKDPSGSTSNMWGHLRRNHPAAIGSPEAKEVASGNHDRSEMEHGKSERPRTPSIVWRHFSMLNEDTVSCLRCNKTFSKEPRGSTSNLWSHLRIHHPDVDIPTKETASGNHDEMDHEMEQAKSERPRTSSIVWSHFSLLSEDTVCCLRCNKTFSKDPKGSTSNLLRHLKNHHPDVDIPTKETVSGSELEQAKSDAPRTSSIVWNHFTILDEDYVYCLHCNTTFSKEPRGSTSNMLRHLKSHHPDVDVPTKETASGNHDGREMEQAKSERPRTSSIAWSHFSLLNEDTVCCLHCNKTFSKEPRGSTSNMLRHLKNHHPNVDVPTKETASGNHDGSQMEHGKSERPRTSSIAWSHFSQLSEDYVCCLHCNKTFNKEPRGSTSNMLRHLKNHHPDVDVPTKETASGNHDGSEMEHMESGRQRQPSIVWNHFTILDEDHVSCLHCDKTLNKDPRGSTSNMLRHLNSYHPDVDVPTKETASGNHDGSEMEHMESRRPRQPSIVWNHFTILDEDHVSCLHCDQIFNKEPRGSTSNMWSHLRRYHPTTINHPEAKEVVSGDHDESEMEHVESGRPRQPSIVWNHFTILDEDHVSCLHCDKTLNKDPRGSTSNMLRHLKSHHPDVDVPTKETESGDHDESEMEHVESGRPRQPSIVWNHFTILDEDHVSCLHCDKTLNKEPRGSTSNMLRHLKGHHLDVDVPTKETASGDHDGSEIEHMESGRPRQPSIVWNHFTILDEDHVSCLHCDKIFNKEPRGSTTNMLRHLKSHHPTTISHPEAKEVVFGNHDGSEMEHVESGRPRQPSIVWNHFTILDEDHVSCLHCDKTLNKEPRGSTSNMLRHLKGHHLDVDVPTKETASGDHDGSEMEHVESGRPRQPSIVWNHFTILDEDHVSCLHCDKIFNKEPRESTSNMLRHLKSHHPTTINHPEAKEVVSGDHDASEMEEMESVGTRPPSIVWNHFTILDENHISCLHCNKNLMKDRSGSTSNMLGHLKRYHPTVIDQESGGTRPPSIVWNHFTILDENNLCCLHCDQNFCKDPTGSTSNMLTHLKRYHPTAIGLPEPEAKEGTSVDHDASELEEMESGRKRQPSIVWNHFTFLDESNLSCNYCNKNFMKDPGGSTSNMWSHLRRNHPTAIDHADSKAAESGGYEATEMQQRESGGTRPPSIVWSHFTILDGNNLCCLHCDQNFCKDPTGSTSNMLTHLKRYHPTAIGLPEPEAKEGTSRDHGGSGMEHMPTTRQQPSIVWDHFTFLNEDTVACRHCNKTQPKGRGGCTSNMLKHIRKYHSALIDHAEAKEVASGSYEESVMEEMESGMQPSMVWKHFTFVNENTVSCLHCDITQPMKPNGSTVNMWSHLRNSHPSVIDSPETEEEASDNHVASEMQYTESDGSRPRSIVWSHFAFLDEMTVSCLHCDKTQTNCGNTTNMMAHLKKYHPEELGPGYLEEREMEDAGRSKTRKPSIVWNHWTILDEDTVSCLHCDKTQPKRDNTTNMMMHLRKYHPEEIGSANHDESEMEHMESGKTRQPSIVWYHFRIVDKDNVACRHCEKVQRNCGNTTNMMNHLRNHHPVELRCGNYDESELENRESGSGRPKSSIVWNHFTTLDNDIISCRYCGKTQRHNGNTTNMLTHLKKYHPEELGLGNHDENETQTQRTVEDKERERTRQPSIVWNHFAVLDESTVSCRHCGKTQPNCGNTTNMLTHLKKHHPEELGQNVTRKPSIVWNHWTILDESTVSCLHCDKTQTKCGNTTNMMNHLRKYHPEELESGNQEASEMEHAESEGSKPHSIVWDHFTFLDENTVSCLICDKTQSYLKSMGTTNMLKHLRKYHPKELGPGVVSETEGPKPPSVVWNHFFLLDDDNVSCVHCKSSLKKDPNGSTSNLWVHLRKSHPTVVETLTETKKATSDKDEVNETECAKSDRPRTSSTVWSHFSLLKADIVSCLHCQKTYHRDGSGSTSNLWKHLKSHHPGAEPPTKEVTQNEEPTPGDHELNETEHTQKKPAESGEKSGRRKQSVVWDHFTFLNEDTVSCLHCSKTQPKGRGGCTSNMLKHLKMYHPAVIGSKERPAKASKPVKFSKVWRHMTELDFTTASCLYCKKRLKKQTPIMLSHLKKKHPAMLSGNHFETFKTEVNIDGASEHGVEAAVASVLQLQLPTETPQRGVKSRGGNSELWSHFTLLSQGTVCCRHCNKTQRRQSSSTSNMVKHLKKRHGVVLGRSQVKDSPGQSMVWSHFTRPRKGSSEASCHHCKKIYKYTHQGGTSNMLRHLRMNHSIQIKQAEDENYSASESTVWSHFTRLRNGMASCRYCKKSYKGSMGNMLRHLRSMHPLQFKEMETETETEDKQFPDVLTVSKTLEDMVDALDRENMDNESPQREDMDDTIEYEEPYQADMGDASDLEVIDDPSDPEMEMELAQEQAPLDHDQELQLTMDTLQTQLEKKELELSEAYKIFNERIKALKQDMKSIKSRLSQKPPRKRGRPPKQKKSPPPQASKTPLARTPSVSYDDVEPPLTMTCTTEPSSPGTDYGHDDNYEDDDNCNQEYGEPVEPVEDQPLRSCYVRLEDCMHMLGPNGVYYLPKEKRKRRSQRVQSKRVRRRAYRDDDSYDEDDNNSDDPDWEDPGYGPKGAGGDSDDDNNDDLDDDDDDDDDTDDGVWEKPKKGGTNRVNRKATTKSSLASSSKVLEGKSSGEVYVCNLCDERFTKKYYMKLHRLLHDRDATLSQCLAQPLKDVTVFKLAKCRRCGEMLQDWDQINKPPPRDGEQKDARSEPGGSRPTFLCAKCEAIADSPEAQEFDDSDDGDGTESLSPPDSPNTPPIDYVPPTEDVENPLGETYICHFCGDRFTKKYYMKLHRLIHDSTATLERCLSEPIMYAKTVLPFQCEICDRRLRDEDAHRAHQRLHTEDIPQYELNEKGRKTYKCKECDVVCVGARSFCDHRERHRGEKSHVCRWCGKTYLYHVGLVWHQKWACKKRPEQDVVDNQRGRNHTCEACGRSFYSHNILMKHLATHSEERPFKCTKCNKSFKTKAILWSHLTTHDTKQFLCDTCGRGFRKMCHLRYHTKTHTGEKPHQCDQCPRRFLHLHTLKKHYFVHTRESKHVCPICDRKFATLYNLKNHNRVHTKEKPYYCKICDKHFGYIESLTIHNRKKHSYLNL
ncbi:uncharacterized protein LOC134447235 isoform X2 [Engraulis encrasicolus]|uniref:uncharacterized protein LOC134447235 isoform X2 n=1 Tax=Engraulis encrasicolus TaxID=184585 RepID=UPI002FD690AC